jgi:hypothetical protein
MKPKKPLPKKGKAKPATKKQLQELAIVFHLPPGCHFDDIFITTGAAAEQLKVCKRTVNNMRRDGKLSSTTLHAKTVYLFKQEIAGIMMENKVERKKK